MNTLYARKTGEQYQTLISHCRQTAQLASERFPELHDLLFLCGLLHDMGKGTKAFQRYLMEDGKRGEVEHSIHGAAFVWKRWRNGDPYRMLCAEWICNAISSHHGRLPDVLTSDGEPYVRPETPPDDLEEAVNGFFTQVEQEARLDALFESAVLEVKAMMKRISDACADMDSAQQSQAQFNLMGLAQREIFSRLIDADRWDAYCFETKTPLMTPSQKPWEHWQERLETRLRSFAADTPIARQRALVADECFWAANGGDSVYRLCVPTGGGKTFSSLRFALENARLRDRPRIVYAAPYKAILEQTADTLRDVLQDQELILEHHSDISHEDETAQMRYDLLTQRWDAPLVLTTMVQLLNTLFLGRGASARRFGALRGCVLILDEVQSIPLRCWYPLNLALRYLVKCAGCSVVLCTATQPLLERTKRFALCQPLRIIKDEEALYKAFRRVKVQDRSEREIDADTLAQQVYGQLAQCGSALCIVNTKASARVIYDAISRTLPQDTPLYCLTTALCPAHRLKLLGEIRSLLHQNRPVVCVATQLIEAGVDVSFGLVVRALCGLSSLAQAAGRCNRHGEKPSADVWLVRMQGENLKQLADIRNEQLRMLSVLDAFHAQPERFGNDVLSPLMLEQYFYKTLHECEPEMEYPLEDGMTLLDLLSANLKGRRAYQDAAGHPYTRTIMAQAFRSAGRQFRALDVDSTSVLVPYGDGVAVIDELARATDLKAVYALLKKAQPYLVSVYRGQWQLLKDEHALRELPACWAVGADWYDHRIGLGNRAVEMELMTV